MEGSNYNSKWGQEANDVGRMSNCRKEEEKSEKRKE